MLMKDLRSPIPLTNASPKLSLKPGLYSLLMMWSLSLWSFQLQLLLLWCFQPHLLLPLLLLWCFQLHLLLLLLLFLLLLPLQVQSL